jgi:hypothetical protein
VPADTDERGASLAEALVVWALVGLVGVAVVVTYWRLPPSAFYNVSDGGAEGAFGRALVFSNFPVALIALALVAPAIDRLRGRLFDLIALVGVVLCLVVVVPGVVDQGDLDAKAVNAIPAVGVLILIALTLLAVARAGVGEPRSWRLSDLIRALAVVALVLAAIPWIFAELGFYVGHVPGLGSLFMSDEITPEPNHPDLRAVHLGHHHGLDGVLFVFTAIALSRELAATRRPLLRTVLSGYLSLMLVYGLANSLEDFWLEQLVKRDVTPFKLPGMLHPNLTPEWAAIIVASALVYFFAFRPAQRA